MKPIDFKRFFTEPESFGEFTPAKNLDLVDLLLFLGLDNQRENKHFLINHLIGIQDKYNHKIISNVAIQSKTKPKGISLNFLINTLAVSELLEKVNFINTKNFHMPGISLLDFYKSLNFRTGRLFLIEKAWRRLL